MKKNIKSQLKKFFELLRDYLKSILTRQRKLGIVLMLLGVVVGIVGFLNHYGKLQLSVFATKFFSDFYTNISTDLISIALTILVIDRLNEQRATEQIKRQLIRDLSSSDYGFATRAARELKANDWLYDGSLNGADISGANLYNENLYGLQMVRGWLIGANLEFTNLNNATISDVTMNGSRLTEARMRNINLSESYISGSVLYKAVMTNSDLRRTDLSDSNLVNAILSDSNMEQASVENSDLSGANLTNVNLHFGKLIKANLIDSNLSSAILTNAFLYRANLTNANLENANFENADCREVLLLGARIDLASLSKARALRGAIMPDGSRYDGRFRLYWDELSAKNRGIDLDNPEIRQWWYLNDV